MKTPEDKYQEIMKTPEKIYLSKDQEHGATWGEEKIRDDDARYIREDIHEKALDVVSEESYTKGLLDARTYKEKAETFTKEQVIELTEKAWNDSYRTAFNRIVAQLIGDDKEVAITNYKQWLKQEKLLNAK